MLLLLAYEMGIRTIGERYFPRAENVPIANAMNVQNYLYEQSSAAVVIVGSSLSNRLIQSALPSDAYNLALGGLSALDGLHVINSVEATPRLVLIEANVLFRAQDLSFLGRLLDWPMLESKRILVSLRDRTRPAVVMLSYGQAVWRRLFAGSVARPGLVATLPVTSAAGADLFNRLLDHQRAEYSSPIPTEELDDELTVLDKELHSMEARGVRVAFFELPTNPALCELPRARELRSAIKLRYARLPYLNVGDCSEVRTTDGVHLSVEEGRYASEALNQAIDKLMGASR